MSSFDVPEAQVTWHRRGAAHFVGSLALLLAAALVTDSFGARSAAVLAGALLCVAILAGVLLFAGWWRHRWSLLLWPVASCAALGVHDEVAPRVTTLVTGLVVLSFLYVGLSLPPYWGLWLVVPASVLFTHLLQLTPREAVIRVPIAAVVWIICSEVPARLISELHRKNAALEQLATTDSLTGLLNRSRLDIQLETAGSAASVALIDLDHFKNFNDTRGHVAGDLVLMDFATTLREQTRPGDAVFRYGGEEFLIVLAGTRPDQAARVLDRIRSVWSEHGSGLTFSAGVTGGGLSSVHVADTLLYEAKAQGRDRVVLDTGWSESASA